MSSGCLGMNPIPATYKMINETDLPPKPNSLSSNSSLRRTLSAADMSSSSHKWLIHSSMKRAQSSQQLDALGDQEQENNDHDDRLRIHQEEIHDNNEEKKGAFDDIWSSILSSKKIESGSGSGSGSDDPPYVHPLVKRTTSSLSEKSLEICTESLGSETGSDGFGSEESDSQQPELHEPIGIFNATVTEYETTPKQLQIVNNVPLSRAVEYETNYNYKRAPPTPKKSVMSSSSSSSFPPPLPSLSHRMRSHRHDGRLVVEAVSVPTTTCLRALRRDGRLLLTLSSDPGDADVVDGDNPMRQDAQDFNEDDRHDRNRDDVDDDERKELTIEFVMEEQASCRMIMSKVIGGEWRRPRNFNATVIKDLDNDEIEENSLPSVIPSVNAYEYYWRRSDGHHATAVLKQFPSQVVVTDENGNNKWVLGRTGKKITAQAQAQAQTEAQQEKEKVKVKVNEVVVEKAAEYLVPFLRGCKEPRRSLLFWEPHCIATS